MINLFISDISKYVGKNKLDNITNAKELNYPVNSLINKIGFKNIREEKMSNSSSFFGIKALRKLIKKNKNLKNKIEVLIVVTQNPDNFGIPHTSSIIHKELNLNEKIACFDIGLGCSGYVYSLSIIKSFMISNKMKCGVLITSDQYSNILQKNDSNKMLFGDGATATLIENKGVYNICNFSFGTVSVNNNALIKDHNNILSMDGRKIFNFTNETIPSNIKSFLYKNKIKINEIDLFLCHQGSKIVIDTLKKSLKLNDKRLPFVATKIGNTISSTIPFLLYNYIQKSEFKKIIICGFGVGLSWGISLLERND